MKILIMASLTLFLSACSLFPQKYDNNEYLMLVRFAVITKSLETQCRKGIPTRIPSLVNSLHMQAQVLDIYTKNIPNNKEVAEVAQILHKDVEQLIASLKKSGFSFRYCELKAKLLEKKTMRIIEAAGKKTR